jgi:hypothetical protein
MKEKAGHYRNGTGYPGLALQFEPGKLPDQRRPRGFYATGARKGGSKPIFVERAACHSSHRLLVWDGADL